MRTHHHKGAQGAVFIRPENIYVSQTKYLKYQQNIEGNSSFRMGKFENFQSSLAPLTRINSPLPQVIKRNCIDCMCMQMYWDT